MASTASDAPSDPQPKEQELLEYGSKPKLNGHALPNESSHQDESKPEDDSQLQHESPTTDKPSSGDIKKNQGDITEQSASKESPKPEDSLQKPGSVEAGAVTQSSTADPTSHPPRTEDTPLAEAVSTGADADESGANGGGAISKSATPKSASVDDAQVKAAAETSADKPEGDDSKSSVSPEAIKEAEQRQASPQPTETSPLESKDMHSDDAGGKASAAAEPKETSEVSAAPPEDAVMTDAGVEEPTNVASKQATPKEDRLDAERHSAEATTSAEPAADTEMTDAPAHEASGSAEPTKASPAADTQVDLGPSGMSQLTIDNADKTSPPAAASASASTSEASNAKAAREREDDSEEPPASKRARTDPVEEVQSKDEAMEDVQTKSETKSDATEGVQTKTDAMEGVKSTTEAAPAAQSATEASAQAPGGGDAAGLDRSFFDSLSQWSDKENDARDITPFQRREIRKIIGRVKKTKSGGHFRDSVQKLWPFLWDSYVERVDKPMDLGELDRSMRDPSGPILTLGDFRVNLGLIFDNSLAFNGGAHDITAASAQAVRTIWEEVVPIPAEEPTRLRSVPKAKPVRESRTVTQGENTATQRKSAGPPAKTGAATEGASKDGAAVPAAAASASRPAPPPAPAASGNLRRGSSATDGDRPKRTVRAPKPKDIDYTTKPSRKKLKPELQFCDEVLTELMHPRHFEINKWFLEPVDAEGLAVPNYYSIIKKPMDLGKVQQMLGNGDISTGKEFDKNVRLIFENCYSFNGLPPEGHPVAIVCEKLEKLYNSQMKGKDAWLSRHAARSHAAAAAASTSNASDDEDDDDGDGAEGTESITDSREIEELQAKLEEETKKLNGMLLGGNQSLIDIQKGIVDMVQNALIKTAQAVQQARAKHDKAAKKGGKGAKSSAKAHGGRKPGGASAQTKKATASSKKSAPKRTLTGPQKDLIASAINDLENESLDQAIDIIKKDTGQNENTDGELELDIDQLSNEALLKLWDLCKDALPGFGKDTAVAPKSSPEVNRSGPAKQAPKTAAKPKKNKPMSAQEQEARIRELTAIRNLFKPGQEPAGSESQKVTQTPTPMADSSDDSDSEEE